MSYIDVTGKTEDEALRKGLEQLGMWVGLYFCE